MNLNYSESSQASTEVLRKSVEEQLDLILKMEEERKALKKENRILHVKLKEANSLVGKYHRQTAEIEVNTENVDTTNLMSIPHDAAVHSKDKLTDMGVSKEEVEMFEKGIQVDLDTVNTSILNCSKLNEAQSLLKVMDAYESRVETGREQPKSVEKKKSNNTKVEEIKTNKNSGQELAGEMLKLTKELNLTKRELKECEHKYKLRDKEIKDLKKCLETKNEALEKSRKEFNELSILMNSDRNKSIRNMEQEIQTLRNKLSSQEANPKIKGVLTDLTSEYEAYQKESERKIGILVQELADKEKQVEKIECELKKLKMNDM